MLKERQKLIKVCLCVFGGFITHLILGTFYLWGNLTLYATSYFRLNGYPTLQKTTMQLVFPFIYVGISVGSFTGVPIARRLGHKISSTIIMVIYGIAVIITSQNSNFIGFVITMGFIPGLCIGNEYLIPVDNAAKYFPEKKGLINGLILCGLGFAPLVFNPILQNFVNPDNISPNKDGYYPPQIANKFSDSIFKLSWIYLTVGVTGALMMFQFQDKTPEQKYEPVKVLETEAVQDVIQSPQGQEEQQQIPPPPVKVGVSSLKELFSSKYLYLFWGITYFNASLGLMILSNYKTYGITKIPHDDNFFLLVGTIGGFSNGISRFFWSAVLDYISPNTLMIINISMMIILSVTFDFVAPSKAGFMIWINLIYFQYGALYTYFPTTCTKIFGPYYGPYAFNIIYSAIMLQNFTQYLFLQFLLKQINYVGIFYINCGFGVVCLILQLLVIKFNKDDLM